MPSPSNRSAGRRRVGGRDAPGDRILGVGVDVEVLVARRDREEGAGGRPHPRGEDRHPLAEPDVAPARGRHEVAEELMRHLVRDHLDPGSVGAVDLGDGVRGLALGLEVEAEGLQGHDPAQRRERVALAVVGGVEVDDLGRATEVGGRLLLACRGQRGGDRGVERHRLVQASGGGPGPVRLGRVERVDVELADRDGHEVGRRRGGLLPHERAPASRAPPGGQDAGGEGAPAAGNGDAGRVGRLVGGDVVVRVPAHGPDGLSDDDRSGLRVRDPALLEAGRPLQRPLDPAVAHDDPKPAPVANPAARRDRQLRALGVDDEPRRPAADAHAPDLVPRRQVEAEAGKALRGDGVDGRRALEALLGHGVVEVEVIVPDVVAAVADRRKQRVAERPGPGVNAAGAVAGAPSTAPTTSHERALTNGMRS